MSVFAKCDEIPLRNDAIEVEHRRAFADPLSNDALCLGIVITDREVFLEIRLRVLQVRLRLR